MCSVFKSFDADYFIPHVDVTRIKEYREEAAKLTGEPSIALLFRPSERKPSRHHRADRGSRYAARAASSSWRAICASPRWSQRLGQPEQAFGVIPEQAASSTWRA